MSKQLDRVIGAAIEEGLLTAASNESKRDSRPWPVVVMTAVAAWFAAIPLGLMVGLLFLSAHAGPAAACMLAVPILAVSVGLLRTCATLFLEQLAIAGLIIGIALVGFSLVDSARSVSIFGGLALLTFGLAFCVPQNWLRMLLGAAGARLAAEVLTNLDYHMNAIGLGTAQTWQLLTICWLGGHLALARCERKPARLRLATALEAMLLGVGVMIVLMLAYSAGRTFLFSPDLPGYDADLAATYGSGAASSVVLGLIACAWMAKQWPALRSAWFVVTAAVAGLLCWLSAPMGGVLLVLAYSTTSGRQGLAMLAGAGALWILGATYYQLYWPLMYKGLLLLGSGLTLGAVARFAMPKSLVPAPEPEPARITAPADALPPQATPWTRKWIAASCLLALVVANALIWQKEAVIREGQTVFVELAPVDPRSMMQGDYMQLAFALPEELWQSDARRLVLVARREPNGLTRLIGPDTGKPLAANELLIEVIRKHDRWMVVTDAWYFAEGEAQRWAVARYGEFRVDKEGKALLVGLRGQHLEVL